MMSIEHSSLTHSLKASNVKLLAYTAKLKKGYYVSTVQDRNMMSKLRIL